LSKIRWISEALLLALHERVIERSGGMHGVLNQGMLVSALDRPLQRAAYDANADLFRLAAAYAYGISKSHPISCGALPRLALAAGGRPFPLARSLSHG
jgi:death on curing protein